MAQNRPSIPASIKKALIAEVGNKCANPGCHEHFTEIHHVEEWAVYQAHDQRHMIAICPTCHYHVHHGDIVINDETIYRWKGTKRQQSHRDLVYVEPSPAPTLLLGRSAWNTGDDVAVFELNEGNKLGFRTINGDVFLTNLVLTDRMGRELIKITDNHVSYYLGEPLSYRRVPGHLLISTPTSSDFLPAEILTYLQEQEPYLLKDDRLTLLDLEVVAPGKVRIQGVWIKDEYSYDDGAVIISKERVHQVARGGSVVVYESDVLLPTPVLGTDQVKIPLNNFYLGFGVPGVAKEEAVALCQQAEELEKTGEYDRAILKFAEAITMESGIAMAHGHLAKLLCERGDVDAAFEAGRKFLFYSQDKAPALNSLGTILQAKGDLSGAINHFQRSISLCSTHAGAHANLGKALYQVNELDAAIEQIQEAINLDGNNVWFHNDMAMALAAKGDLTGAISCFEKGAGLASSFSGFHNNWAYVLERNGYLADAIERYQCALAIEPEMGIAKANLARAIESLFNRTS